MNKNKKRVFIFSFLIALLANAFIAHGLSQKSVEATPVEPGQQTSGINTVEEVLDYISEKYGVQRKRLTITNEVEANYPVSGRKIRVWKIAEEWGGGSYELCVDENGNPVDIGEIEAEERRKYFEKYGKLSPELYDRLQKMGPDEKVHVWIWLSGIDHNKVISRVMSRYPEVDGRIRVINLRPAPFDENWNYDEDLEYLAEKIYKEILDELEKEYGYIQEQMIDELNKNGFKVSYKTKYAPIVFAELPKWFVIGLSRHENISEISSVRTMEPELNSAAHTVRANVVWDRGIYGRGPKIAVVEGGGISDQNIYLAIPSYFDSANKRISDHATAVAGVIASTHSTYRGIAYRAYGLLSANAENYDDQNIISATEWALSNGANIINNSWGFDTDLQIVSRDRYMDHLVWWHRATVIKSAGNNAPPYGTKTGNVTSPGLGYNVITVGSIDDKDTGSDWSDDIMAPNSSYNDPISPKGDREKPEVVAVGSRMYSTTTSSPWVGYFNSVGGTSFAAPAVAGEVALLMSASPSLRTLPEAVKAIIMASAGRNIEGDRRLSEKDGVGAIICSVADDIRRNGQWKWENLVLGNFPRIHSFTVPRSGLVRVVIVWSSHPPDVHPPPSNPPYEWLESDLNLEVSGPNIPTVRSESYDNPYEIVEFTAPTAGVTYTIKITQRRFVGSYEHVGLAYAFF